MENFLSYSNFKFGFVELFDGRECPYPFLFFSVRQQTDKQQFYCFTLNVRAPLLMSTMKEKE